MHRVEVGGFGRRQPDGGWAYAAWPAFVAARAEKIAAAQGQILRAGFSRADVDFMMRTVLGLPDQAPCATPVLCHGDFVPEPVFVTQDLRIALVIDSDQIHEGPPLADLIHLSFLQPAVDLESVKGGYADRLLMQHGFERQLHLHRLLFLLPCVAHTTATGNPAADKTPDAVGQLRETLAAPRRGDRTGRIRMDWGWPLATRTRELLQTRSAPVEGKELLPASRFEYVEGKATLVVLGTLTLATEVEPKVLAARLDKVHNLGTIHCTPEQMGALQARLGLRQGQLVDATAKPEPPAEEQGVIRIDNAGHLKL